MNIKKCIVVLILLMCVISFVAGPAMAAKQEKGNDNKIVTPEKKSDNKLKEHKEKKIVKQKQTHNKADFTNEVPGVGNLKYEAEKVPPGFEKKAEAVTMVSWHHNGKLHIRDTEHRTATIQVPWSTLQDIEGFDGEHVRVWHYDDSGTCDGKWVQTVRNENGFAYLESVPFSEVLVGGYTGTYSKVESEIDITDTINLGRSFDSDDVSSLTLEIDDQYADKTDPYAIPTDGLVVWHRFDDAGSTVIDYSGNGNNGTFTAATYSTGKYNNGGYFDGVDDFVSCPTITQENVTFNFWYNTDVVKNGGIINFWGSPTVNSYFGTLSGGSVAWIRLNNDLYQYFGSISSYCDGDWHFWSVYIVPSDITQSTLEIDGELISKGSSSTVDSPRSWGSLEFGRSIIGYTNGTIDNVIVYNRSLSDEERDDLYYISASSLQAKTNSHTTYSNEWDGVSTLAIPFGTSESISSIEFNNTLTQNGVIVYNPINVLMDVTATVGYTEDTYIVEEFCDEGFYIDQYAVEISHTPSADNANGLVSYNPTDSLCSDIMSKSWDYALESNNPAATITTFNQNSLVIDTGAITAGTEYSYTVIAEANHIYNDGLTATQQGASIWGTGVSILNVAFTISILAAGIVALKNASDPEKSAKPAVEALVALAIGLVVFTLIATLGTGLGSAIETLLGV